MRIRATITLDAKQVNELIYSLENNERVHIDLDFEFNEIQKVDLNDQFENPIDVWKKIKSIADESTSYDDFVEKVLDWLDLGRQRYYFKSVIQCAEYAQKITWDGIELIMIGHGIPFELRDQKNTSKRINRKLKNVVNSTDILKKILNYKNYKF